MSNKMNNKPKEVKKTTGPTGPKTTVKQPQIEISSPPPLTSFAADPEPNNNGNVTTFEEINQLRAHIAVAVKMGPNLNNTVVEMDDIISAAHGYFEKERFKMKQFYEDKFRRNLKAAIYEFKCAMEKEIITPLKMKLCSYEKEIQCLKQFLSSSQYQKGCFAPSGSLLRNIEDSTLERELLDRELEKALFVHTIKSEVIRKSISTSAGVGSGSTPRCGGTASLSRGTTSYVEVGDATNERKFGRSILKWKPNPVNAESKAESIKIEKTKATTEQRVPEQRANKSIPHQPDIPPTADFESKAESIKFDETKATIEAPEDRANKSIPHQPDISPTADFESKAESIKIEETKATIEAPKERANESIPQQSDISPTADLVALFDPDGASVINCKETRTETNKKVQDVSLDLLTDGVPVTTQLQNERAALLERILHLEGQLESFVKIMGKIYVHLML